MNRLALEFGDRLAVMFTASICIGVGLSYGQIYLFHLLLPLIVVSLLTIYRQRFDFRQLKAPATLFFVFWFGWYLISSTWAPDARLAIKYAVFVLIGLTIVFFCLAWIRGEAELLLVKRIVLAVMLVEALIGLLEIYTGFRWPWSPYSELVGYFGREGTNLQALTPYQRDYISAVPTGFHWNPNHFALFMAMLLPYALFAKRLLPGFMLASVILLLVLFAGSRASLIGTGVGILGWLVLGGHSIWKRVFMAAALVAFSYASYLYVPVPSGKVFNETRTRPKQDLVQLSGAVERLVGEHESAGKEDSVNIRIRLMRSGFRAVRSTRGLGLGAGGHVRRLQQEGMMIHSLHNFWLELLVDGGVVLALSMGVVYIRCLALAAIGAFSSISAGRLLCAFPVCFAAGLFFRLGQCQ